MEWTLFWLCVGMSEGVGASVTAGEGSSIGVGLETGVTEVNPVGTAHPEIIQAISPDITKV
jgi:hypothetical protein